MTDIEMNGLKSISTIGKSKNPEKQRENSNKNTTFFLQQMFSSRRGGGRGYIDMYKYVYLYTPSSMFGQVKQVFRKVFGKSL